MEENLIYFGDTIKALGDGKIGGYLIRFTTPKDPDVTGDFFTKDTDFGIEDGASLPVYYQHGMDGTIKTRKIGRGTTKFDDVGLWVEAQLELRDEYEKAIYEMAANGKLGWSSGAAGHLVEREKIGKSYFLKSWVIAEASLTPTPAEPRNSAVPIKSLLRQEKTETEKVEAEEPVKTEIQIKTEVNPMDENELKTLLSQVADEAAKKAIESLPETKAGFRVEVVEDEADRALKGNPFTSMEFFAAVKNAGLPGGSVDKRLLPLKATGMNETIPSQGGFLVPAETAAGIQDKMWGVGTLLSRFTPIPVSGNRLIMNAIAETSRATGSRWGGVRGYWLAEAGTKVASKPTFRQIDLTLKKVAALCYATDELLEDATALESWLVNSVPNELRFMVEDAIINGSGSGQPLGILNSPALVSATRTDANEIDASDIARMWAARYPGVNDYVWAINANTIPQLLNMTIGQMPAYLPPGGLSGAQYGTLLGRPVIETEYNPSLGSLGDILLISPSQYVMINKGGVQSASSIHVNFVYDETAFRFVYRVDGQPAWDNKVTTYKAGDYVSPFVALAAST